MTISATLPTRAKIYSVSSVTVDCTTIRIRAEITEGPKSLVGRTLDLIIGPETLKEHTLALSDLLAIRRKNLDKQTSTSVISEV